jgi:porin
VAVLLGSPSRNGLPINFKGESGFAIANFSQYLFVKDDAAEIAAKLKSGQVIRGIGIFGRFGYAPQDTNTITHDASIGLFVHGISDGRQYDSFGIGFYYNAISNDLKNDIALLTAGTASVKDEKGIEVFYDFAITPAIRLIPSYQHIWDPLTAQVATKQSGADVFLLV